MADIRILARDARSDLYRRLGFDPGLESEGLASLAALELDRCRRAYGRLIDGLDLAAVKPVQAILLMADMLLRVNRRVHRPDSEDNAHETHRAALIERFAGYRDPEEARRAFMECLNELLAPLGQSAAPHGLVERARSYIESNYQQRISLSSVAGHVHASPNYLSRIFRRETGMTLTHYTHTVRLEHARMLLASGERSISEIAYLVGYQNYRDFYRNFVKYMKASPREVRARLSPVREGDDPAVTVEGA